jgi:hypothetical protein
MFVEMFRNGYQYQYRYFIIALAGRSIWFEALLSSALKIVK